jgi:hypothetical protein
MDKKLVKLKNTYTGEIVYCENIKDEVKDAGYIFIKVYKEELPQRKYLVNKNAFVETK